MTSQGSRSKKGVSRRAMLRDSAAAALGGSTLLGSAAAQGAQAPAIARGTTAGRSFRALVRHGTGVSVEELRLRPIQPRQVVVQSQAVAPCYTIVRSALGTTQARRASVPNHCGFGVVVEVGADVRRVQVGDRVVVAGTSQCGVCYQCLQGRSDYCQFTWGGDDFPPFADMRDGTAVFQDAGIGGISELMAVYEEYCVPVFTDLPAAQLTLLGDQLASGFAAGHALLRFEPGSDVVVFGVGPVGLGTVQAGRALAAGQVIAVDPVRYRREFATRLGATTVLDPVAEGADLVERIRELCQGRTGGRRMAGGPSFLRTGNATNARGADFVVEAAGLQAFPPKVEPQPDPTNVSTVRQAWECTRQGGHVMLMGLTAQEVPFPGVGLALLGRTIHAGQQGGLHVLRDLPRYVRLIEKGVIDAQSIITRTYSLADARQAIQDTADRTIITGVIEFPS